MSEKIQRIIISWFEIDQNNQPQEQIRRYKDPDKANAFIETLKARNVLNYKKKIIYSGNLEGGETECS